MTFSFDPSSGLIPVPTRISGPAGDVIVSLALDTGATSSMVNWDIAALLGYDPAAGPERFQIVTGSGVEYAPRIEVESVEALGRQRKKFALICHTLPPNATVDGVLGLDFFRGWRLTVDLATGSVTVE